MSARLEQHRDTIEQLRREGRSVRAIATALSEMTGERYAASSIHNFLKVQQLPLSADVNGGFNGNSNGRNDDNETNKNKESVQIPQAPHPERPDHVEVRLEDLSYEIIRWCHELQSQVEQVRRLQIGVLFLCALTIVIVVWSADRNSLVGLAAAGINFVMLVATNWDEIRDWFRPKRKFWISPNLAVYEEQPPPEVER